MRQSISTSVLLIAFVALNGVVAQLPFPGRCPKVALMDSFNLEEYLGVWYEYSKYPAIFEVGNKCVSANYEANDSGSVTVINSAVSKLTGSPKDVVGTAKVVGPAQLAVQFSEFQPANKANYNVLGSDYKTYAVVQSCTNVLVENLQFLWILTRERQPTQETIDAALKVVKDNKLNAFFLKKTDQDGCPSVSSLGKLLA